MLAERRSRSPKGLGGGLNGEKAMTILVKKDGSKYNFGGKNTSKL